MDKVELKMILIEQSNAYQTETSRDVAPFDIPFLNQDKNTVLKLRVVPSAIGQKETTIQNMLSLINKCEENRQQLQLQIAGHGGSPFAPLSLLNQLQEQTDCILKAGQ